MPAPEVRRWRTQRSFHHSRFPVDRLAARGGVSVSVCLPARECADQVGAGVSELAGLLEAGLIDELVVIDAASRDGTGTRAAQAGATVYQEADLLPDHGPVLGKGDAMWRALSVLQGDLICYLDADNAALGAHYVSGLVGPLLDCPEVGFVKAAYRRPVTVGEVTHPDGGGRVSQLAARPALALFYPELGGVRQPLAGEVAARRRLLERLPYACGYGVEMAMLLDAYSEVGLFGIAQVDVDVHENTHQPVSALGPMSYAVLGVLARRLEREGRLSALAPGPLLDSSSGQARAGELPERPPLGSLGPTVRPGGSPQAGAATAP